MLNLSIIIPVYNVEKYLPACLDSVIYPELEGYEVIIVNDGSTDSSPAIAAAYTARNPALFRLITTENGGLGHARNTGLEAARGEYVQFLDSDDRLAENAVPEMLEALKGGFDIGIFDFVAVGEDGRVLSRIPGCARQGSFDLASYPELLFAPPNACTKIWRRELFSGLRFPDRMWFEDLCTTPKLYLRAKKISFLPRPWYLYLQRTGSITKSADPCRNLEMIEACRILLAYFKEQGQFERYLPQLEYMLLYNELITSSTRVNLIDRKSPVQDALLEYYLSVFPNYRQNPYIQGMSGKLKLLLYLIERRKRLALNLVMRLNNALKGR